LNYLDIQQLQTQIPMFPHDQLLTRLWVHPEFPCELPFLVHCEVLVLYDLDI
jgi:hypothetical protein